MSHCRTAKRVSELRGVDEKTLKSLNLKLRNILKKENKTLDHKQITEIIRLLSSNAMKFILEK